MVPIGSAFKKYYSQGAEALRGATEEHRQLGKVHFCSTAHPPAPAAASLPIAAHGQCRAASILSGWKQALKRTNFNPKRYERAHLIYTMEPSMGPGPGKAPSPSVPPLPSCDQQVGKWRHRASHSPGVTQQVAPHTQTRSSLPPNLCPNHCAHSIDTRGRNSCRLVHYHPNACASSHRERQNHRVTQQVHSRVRLCVLSPEELKRGVEAKVPMFIAALFPMAKDGDNPDVHQLMGKYIMLYPDNGV